jgi:hypothetical protein
MTVSELFFIIEEGIKLEEDDKSNYFVENEFFILKPN